MPFVEQILVPTSEHDGGWSIDQTRQILTGERLKLALQNTRSSLNVMMFPKNSVEYMGRNMMLVTTVQWDVDIAKKQTKASPESWMSSLFIPRPRYQTNSTNLMSLTRTNCMPSLKNLLAMLTSCGSIQVVETQQQRDSFNFNRPFLNQ